MLTKMTISLLVLLGLGGCSIMSERFDSTEYQSFVSMKTEMDVIHNGCNSDKASDELQRGQLLVRVDAELKIASNYTKYIDPNAYGVVTILQKQTKEWTDRYNSQTAPSNGYCSIKSELIQTELDKVLTALGKRR